MKSTAYSKRLEDCRNYALKILAAVEGNTPSGVSALDSLTKELSELAQKVVDDSSSPVKIGVVGEFSAGKTLLLGALVGYGDLLPVSETPTTGNVTALRFRQRTEDDKIAQTVISNYRVAFLSRDRARECFSHMLLAAADQSVHAKLPSIAECFEELASRAIAEVVHREVQEHCHSAWEQTHSPGLRYLIRELMVFLQCDAALGELLYEQTVDVPPNVAREGLTLARAGDEISSQGFAELTQKPATFDLRAGISAEQIRAAFPLILRCEATLEVSKAIWDLSGLRKGNEFILLDFPGLGADESSVRDRYLCLRELQETQTILILLNGHRPGSGGTTVLYDMMLRERGESLDDQKDRYLVGVGRFDQIPLDSNQKDSILQMLDESNSGGLLPQTAISERRIVENVEVLDRLVKSARGFTTRNDRIHLLSPIRSLRRLNERRETRRIEIATPTLKKEITDRAAAKQCGELVDKIWAPMARQLRTQHPKESGLGAWLENYADDGGVAALRETLQKHVAEHGLRQLCLDVDSTQQVLEKSRKRLLRMLAEQTPKQDPASPAMCIRTAITNLISKYNTFRLRFEEQPPELCTDQFVLPDGGTIRLDEWIHRQAIVRVGRWEEWRRLLNIVRDGHLEPPARLSSDSLLPPTEDNNSEPPMAASDFLKAFRTTCQVLEGEVRRLASASIEDWLEMLATELSDEADELREYLDEDPDRADSDFISLRMATNPMQFHKPLIQKCAIDSDQPASDIETWDRLFLLAPEKLFPWSPQIISSFSEQSRHQTQLRRLNRRFVESISQEFTELVGRVNKLAVKFLRSTFEELDSRLRTMSGSGEFIASLLHEHETLDSEESDLATKLSQIPPPSQI